MGIRTHRIFVKALKSNETLMSNLAAGTVYSTAIQLPDAEIDNAELPYIIVTNNGGSNDNDTKDESFEGTSDEVNVSIEIAAKNEDELVDLAAEARKTVRDYFEQYAGMDGDDYDLIPYDYQMSFDAVAYDSMKPCFWTTMRYRCDIDRD